MRSSVLRTLGFLVVYLVATYAGRLTVMDQTDLSLVWPAAGVSAVWFLVQYRSRWRGLDVLALPAVTVGVNVATAHRFTWPRGTCWPTWCRRRCSPSWCTGGCRICGRPVGADR
uniref:hypothetical protein n=1 Tax=Paractinoplanes polyasparticus TaxID=2856853 RepID=UPI001C85E908|nr:hypothetical protein [Actinoplanes polyasparticus]